MIGDLMGSRKNDRRRKNRIEDKRPPYQILQYIVKNFKEILKKNKEKLLYKLV